MSFNESYNINFSHAMSCLPSKDVLGKVKLIARLLILDGSECTAVSLLLTVYSTLGGLWL